MGASVYGIAPRLNDGEWLRLAPARQPKTVLADRGWRWSLETRFAALKTRGRHLESTHFWAAERLNELIALLVLGFCGAMPSGL